MLIRLKTIIILDINLPILNFSSTNFIWGNTKVFGLVVLAQKTLNLGTNSFSSMKNSIFVPLLTFFSIFSIS
jgi:hypothetical protein